MNKAIFLDRDGVLNHDKGYVHKKEDCEFFTDTFEALKKAPKDFKLIIITNQAGIAKGIYTEDTFHEFNKWMLDEFKKNDVKIDKVYYCPHRPTGATVKKYAIKCDCRKPAPGMLLEAAKEFNLDLTKCWLIGDKSTDIGAGQHAGCKTILLKTRTNDNMGNVSPNHEAKTLTEAIKIIDSKSSAL